MSKLNELNCSVFTKNTGFNACYLDWKLFKGAFIYQSPRTFSAAELANLETTLQDDAFSDVKSTRAYPIHNFVALTDNTEDVIIQTFDYGAKAIVRDGDYDWTFEFQDGGACLTRSGRTLNGKQYMLFYDSENKILGQDLNGQFSTIPLQFLYFKPFKSATGSAAASYGMRAVFNARYGNEDSAVVKSDFDLSEITGLQDIVLEKNGFNHNTGMLNVSIVTDCGASDLYGQYSAKFTVGLWNASNTQTGAPITITSVTPIAGTSSFNVQLLHSDPDWPADGTISVGLAVPSLLTAAGIAGYEAVVLEVDVSGS
jgi:hypothetical protein